MAKERVVLVDGSALIYRAFFAIPAGFATSGGVPTNATYGFALMFRKIFGGKAPTYGAVVFDAPGKTFRDERFPQYKAQRPRMPAELREQIPWIHRLVETRGFPMLKVEGYEADDVIATLTREALAAGHEVHIISGDKDFAQLVGPDVRMVDPMKEVSYDPELVRKKWGVRPERFVDFLALVGDKVDNVPGVAGVGPKTAIQLLERYGDLDGVLAHAEEQKGKLKERLLAHADDARLSRELVRLDTEVPLQGAFASSIGSSPAEPTAGTRALTSERDVTLDGGGGSDRLAESTPAMTDVLASLRVPPPDEKAVDALYRELEFFSLLSGEEAETRAEESDLAALAPADAPAFFEALGAAALFALHDTPPEGRSALSASLLGLAFAPLEAKGERARYLPLAGEGDAHADALAAARTWLADASKAKITHDLRDVLTLFARHDLPLEGVVGDTRLASFLIDPTRDIPHRLEQLTRRWLHRTLLPLEGLVGKGGKKLTLGQVSLAEVAPYAAHLAATMAELWPKLEEALEAEGQGRFLREIELPLSEVLARMQLDGIGADAAVLDALGVELSARRDEIEAEVHALAGRSFNLASAKQLGEVLFDELKLPVLKRTKTGYSTAADVLERLAHKHPVVAQILRWRALAKLVNTYTRVLRDAIEEDGRIHCRIQQTVGASGRLITTDPDLQRTPIRTEDGRRIREAFVPRPGWVLISADWSQIELRVLAHVSGDALLVEAFQQRIDVHRRTASQIYGVAPEAVTGEQRNVGKTVNFATIYGQGATALGQSLDLPRAEAKALIERYFEAYAGVRRWLDGAIAQAHERGYVETLMGRRRYVPELSSRDPMERAYGERIAANTPIQGSAADLCKLAMLDIARGLEAEGLSARMLLQIHDELLFEAPPEEVERTEALVRRCMEGALALDVPLVVDVGHGASWAAAKA
ncbi:MAG: DNA polymerase I [Myxococcales bacterium]|nr:DNA polymerase I [Myxococcales bacterium]